MRKFDYIILGISLAVLVFIGTLYTYTAIPKIIKTEKVEIIEDKKPSYDYLRSITVYIIGEIPEPEEEKEAEISDDPFDYAVMWGGTGSVIKIDEEYTYILTNAHVAGKGKEDVSLYIKDDLQTIPAELVSFAKSDLIDLAVIRIKGTLKDKQVVKGFSIAKPQDKVYLTGHHLGRPYVYGEGVFAGYDGIYGIIQVPILYGNSGTGVCNEDGEIIGVVFAGNIFGFFQFDTSHGLIIDGISVQAFLKELNLL